MKRLVNREHQIPDIKVPTGCEYLIEMFWEMRSFVGPIDSDGVLDMSVIKDWQSHHGIKLDRWERVCMFETDRALRRAYYDVVKFHAGRDKVGMKKGK